MAFNHKRADFLASKFRIYFHFSASLNGLIMMLIDNNNYRMFRPEAIMIVGKAKINAPESFWISHQY